MRRGRVPPAHPEHIKESIMLATMITLLVSLVAFLGIAATKSGKSLFD
jgi:hypothetical protein